MKFATVGLPGALSEARSTFEEYKDLLSGYAFGELSYVSFAFRVKRRSLGLPEDFEQEQEDSHPVDEDYLDDF